MTVNVQSALRTYLAAQLPTFSVYAGVTYPASSYKPGNGPGVAFKVRGGQETEEDQLLIPSVQFKVYGSSPLGASTNYLALDAVLKSPASSSILWTAQEGLGVNLVEPETGWDFVLAYYQVQIRNN